MIMLKRDWIFWCAAGIFALAAILAVVTKNDQWLLLMAASYLLRPTLASLGLARRLVDERQMSIQYRSGNIAFASMLAAAIIISIMQQMKGDHSWELFNIVIVVGLAAKALFNVLLVKNYREAGSRIIMAVGLLATLFAAAENGLTLGGLMESAPWLVIAGIGWLSRKFPKTIGAIIFVVTAVLLAFILSKGFTVGQMATAAIVCIPMSLAGACLFARQQPEAGA
jgi:hypothetical protein